MKQFGNLSILTPSLFERYHVNIKNVCLRTTRRQQSRMDITVKFLEIITSGGKPILD